MQRFVCCKELQDRESGGKAMAPSRMMTTDGSGDWITPYPASPSIDLIVKTRMFRSTLIATGVGDNADWVERVKEGWETKVIELLDAISNGTWTQRTIMAAIRSRCAEKPFKVLWVQVQIGRAHV